MFIMGIVIIYTAYIIDSKILLLVRELPYNHTKLVLLLLCFAMGLISVFRRQARKGAPLKFLIIYGLELLGSVAISYLLVWKFHKLLRMEKFELPGALLIVAACCFFLISVFWLINTKLFGHSSPRALLQYKKLIESLRNLRSL